MEGYNARQKQAYFFKELVDSGVKISVFENMYHG